MAPNQEKRLSFLIDTAIPVPMGAFNKFLTIEDARTRKDQRSTEKYPIQGENE